MDGGDVQQPDGRHGHGARHPQQPGLRGEELPAREPALAAAVRLPVAALCRHRARLVPPPAPAPSLFFCCAVLSSVCSVSLELHHCVVAHCTARRYYTEPILLAFGQPPRVAANAAIWCHWQIHGLPALPMLNSINVFLQVRRTPCWPRSWANCSRLQLYPHRNAWASLGRPGEPDACLAAPVAARRAPLGGRRPRLELRRDAPRGLPPHAPHEPGLL